MTTMPDHENTDSVTEKQSNPSLIRRYFLYVLIGGLVVSALISIVSVLIGEFNEAVGKSLLTTISIVIHALLGLAFLSTTNTQSTSSKVLTNTLFTIVVASLITSIFGIWEIFSGRMAGNFYATYFLAFLTTCIVSILLQSHQKDQTTRLLMWSSIASVVTTFIVIVPYLFADNIYILPEVYGRITWALVILSSTLAVLTGIFNHLYTLRHPEPRTIAQPGTMPVWLRVVLILIALFFTLPIIVPFLSLLVGY